MFIRILSSLCVIMFVSVGPVTSHGAIVDKIIALVNNNAITESDVIDRMEELKKSLPKTNELGGSPRQRAIESLINDKVLIGELDKEGITIADDEVEQSIKSRLQAFAMPMTELRKKIEEQGQNYEAVFEEAKYFLMKDKLIQKKILPKIRISEIDIQKYYDGHKSEFTGYQQIRFQEIFLTNESIPPGKSFSDVVSEVGQKLFSGGDFKSLVSQYSRGAFANNQGDSGLLDITMMKPEIANVLLNTELNQVIGPLPAPGQGVFFFKLIDRQSPKIRPFNEVKEMIRMKIGEALVEEELQNYLVGARSRHFIQMKGP